MIQPLLILSGAYVNAEIAAEYGRIPPSFLPLGGQRLFLRQFALARGPVFLTLPADFTIDPVDMQILARFSVKIIRTPAELSLIAALRLAITELVEYPAFDLLHGDTLVDPSNMLEADSLACHDDPGPYDWAYVDESDGTTRFEQGFGDGRKSRRVVCGYQRIGNRDVFAQAAANANSYVDLLNIYSATNPSKFHQVNDWYDFGHLGLLYRSKRKISVTRAFNSISSDEYFAAKSSIDLGKIRAESHWYESLPVELQIFTPRYFGPYDRAARAGYRVEYVYQPLVSDLFVFGDLPTNARIRILSSCFDFLAQCRAVRPQKEAPELSALYLNQIDRALYHDKTQSRLADFLTSTDLNLGKPLVINGRELPPLVEVATHLSAMIPKLKATDISVCHGDFFFGNMFFDYRASRIIAIDPRGSFVAGVPSIWGDQRYDLAKLAHSVIGGYDQILFGRSELTINSENNWQFDLPKSSVSTEVEEYFIDQVSKNYELSHDTLLAMTALLFLSMLPLHADDPVRQHHFLANGLRLASQVSSAW